MTGNADTIHEIVLEKGTEVIRARKAWIMILDKEGERLHLAVASADLKLSYF